MTILGGTPPGKIVQCQSLMIYTVYEKIYKKVIINPPKTICVLVNSN